MRCQIVHFLKNPHQLGITSVPNPSFHECLNRGFVAVVEGSASVDKMPYPQAVLGQAAFLLHLLEGEHDRRENVGRRRPGLFRQLLQANLPLPQFFKGCALVVRYLHHLYNFRNSILNYWAASFVPEHRTYTQDKKISSAFIPHPIGGSRLGKGFEGRFHDNGDGDDGDDDGDDDLASEKVARSDSISGILAALSYKPTNRLTPTVVQEGLVQSI